MVFRIAASSVQSVPDYRNRASSPTQTRSTTRHALARPPAAYSTVSACLCRQDPLPTEYLPGGSAGLGSRPFPSTTSITSAFQCCSSNSACNTVAINPNGSVDGNLRRRILVGDELEVQIFLSLRIPFVSEKI